MSEKKKNKKLNKMSLSRKISVVLTCIITVMLAITVGFAWFSNKKQVATIAKINSPAKLSLKAGNQEDIINFKMAGIDVTKGSSKDFVFCVEGEDISKYSIQLAHTTNINFTYTIYRATETNDTTKVEYTLEGTDQKVYYDKTALLSGAAVNESTDTVVNSRKLGNTSYQIKSYDDDDTRQKFAEPLYWQSVAITANESPYDYNSAERAFVNYYVLTVSWGEDVTNDKETDMIYLTAQVTQ
ncbi:MAG: hypothetical protein IJM32_10915 [Ruminococcus sp.]|nr:hypothetical protein [Ruminococcus sp.]